MAPLSEARDWFELYKKMVEEGQAPEPMRNISKDPNVRVEEILLDLYWASYKSGAQFTPVSFVDMTIYKLRKLGLEI